MKVLFDGHAIDQKKTGIERYTSNLIKFLPSGNLELVVYYPLVKNGLFRILLGIMIKTKKVKPDIVHASFFAPLIKLTPVVITVHDLCFKSFPTVYSRRALLAFNLFFKKSLMKSDAIISVSETVKKDLIEIYSIDPNKIFTVYEAPDKVFRPIANKAAAKLLLKKKFNVIHDYFLIVGAIEKRKNPIPIINSFLNLSKDFKRIQLVFAGPDNSGDLIKKQFNNSIKSNKLKILGYIDEEDLNLLYNCSLALIYNSVCEGFGLPILEAMATKTPVICNKLEVFKEVAGESAIFFKTQSELLLAMKKIAADKSFRNKYKALGYKRSKSYSWIKAAKKTSNIYSWVLRNQKFQNNLVHEN